MSWLVLWQLLYCELFQRTKKWKIPWNYFIRWPKLKSWNQSSEKSLNWVKRQKLTLKQLKIKAAWAKNISALTPILDLLQSRHFNKWYFCHRGTFCTLQKWVVQEFLENLLNLHLDFYRWRTFVKLCDDDVLMALTDIWSGLWHHLHRFMIIDFL